MFSLLTSSIDADSRLTDDAPDRERDESYCRCPLRLRGSETTASPRATKASAFHFESSAMGAVVSYVRTFG